MSNAVISTPDEQTINKPELPPGWDWQGGSGGLILFGTQYDMGGPLAGVHGLGGYSGRIDQDGSGVWWVNIEPVTRIERSGYHGETSPVYGHAVSSRSYGTEQAAYNAVPELIRRLSKSA